MDDCVSDFLATPKESLTTQGAEFEPTEIKAVQQQRGLTEADLWRYLIVWLRRQDGSEVRFTANKVHHSGWLRQQCWFAESPWPIFAAPLNGVRSKWHTKQSITRSDEA